MKRKLIVTAVLIAVFGIGFFFGQESHYGAAFEQMIKLCQGG